MICAYFKSPYKVFSQTYGVYLSFESSKNKFMICDSENKSVGFVKNLNPHPHIGRCEMWKLYEGDKR